MATMNRMQTTPGLKVRMYRQGLGDCFLITLPTATGKAFRMLIDCGVVLGTPNPSEKMRGVVEDIRHETGGRIDVLVATHEHWDHVSGFVQAEAAFAGFEVGAVWLAWTEDPNDKLATKLREERRTAEKALRLAANRLALDGSAETAGHVESLLGFFGAAENTTAKALANVNKLCGDRPRYCQPGERPIELKEAPGLRFWILGPPKNEKLIKKSNPSKGDAYGLDAGPGGSQRFLMSAFSGHAAGAAQDAETIEEPFDSMYCIPLRRAEKVPFFQQRYFGEAIDGVYDRKTRTNVKDQSWRRIDSAWMESAETMALQLDAATNNTSLVLAIEIIGSGEVLLFPGDAQAGNWLSWQDLAWELPADVGGKPVRVTGPDLLARTVFYKVGHHGSHNATLKAKGLELMTSPDLVAMIPVDHAMAVKKRWNKMPLPDLVEELTKRSRGRLLQVDDPVTSNAEFSARVPEGVSPDEWADFARRVNVTPLYYELAF